MTNKYPDPDKNFEEKKENIKKIMNYNDTFLKAIEQSATTIVITDKKGNIEYVNKKFEELTGYSYKEALGKNPNILKSGYTKQDDYSILWKTIKKGKAWKGIFKNIDKFGNYFWEEATIYPIKNNDNEIINFVGIKEDISQRIIIENKLKNSYEFLQSILDSLPNPTYVINKDFSIEFANKKFKEMFKENYSNSKNKCYNTTHKYSHPCFKEGEPCPLKIVLEKKETTVVKHVHKDSNNKKIHVEIICSPIFDENGNVNKVIEYTIDVTKRVNYEKYLNKAKELAQEAEKAKSDFLANISHEIRTPINGLIGFSELLLSTSLNEDQKRYLDMIKMSSETLNNLISDILEYSKLEAKKIDLVNEKLNLKDLLNDICFFYLIESNKKNFNFKYSIDDSIPDLLYFDSTRLKQIISNLLNNSFKFTKNGYVEMTVKTIENNSKLVKILFTIKDTGIGISKNKINHIFDRFSQADEKIYKEYGGTGLGLSIVKKLVDLMDGEIRVNSQLNKGTKFEIIINFIKYN